MGVTIALALIAILYLIHSKISSVANTADALNEVLSPFKAIGTYIQQKGIEGLGKEMSENLSALVKGTLKEKKGKDPLPPEKLARRNQLIEKSQRQKLSEREARELKMILEEEARIAFMDGVFSFIAFLAILALIGAFIAAISAD